MNRATPHAFVLHDGENIRLRAILMARLRQMMKARRLTQMEAARWFHVSQCRISHLVNDRFNRFTIDALANMLAHAGVHVSIAFEDSRVKVDAGAVAAANANADPSTVRGISARM